jgi:4-diphosphocytidyl-2C-methyl-D-erythritol kinase
MPNTGLISERVDLTDLINSHLEQISRLKEEQAKLKEMLDDIFRNDSTYQSHDQSAKEAAKIRQQTKKQILKLPQAADLSARIQSFRSQIKERNEELSGYLQDYSRVSGANSFETPDGEIRQIIYVAKLVKIGR